MRYYASLFGVHVDADALLRKVLLDDSANVYFMRLSGGQKQKVGLALALVNDPEITRTHNGIGRGREESRLGRDTRTQGRG